MRRLRNFCDCASAGGDGTFGCVRNDAYEGGVALECVDCEALDVDGRYPGVGGGRVGIGGALRLLDDALSLGDGDEFLDRSRSFSRLVLSSPSNCAVNPRAH